MDCLTYITAIINNTNLSAWVTALASIVLTLITFFNLRLFKQAHESRFEPNIIVTLELNDKNEGSPLIFIVIKNIGTGVAENIRFTISRPIFQASYGKVVQSGKQDGAPMTSGPLINGLIFLGPGEQRILPWGGYLRVLDADGNEPIEVISNFTRKGKPMLCTYSYLEIKSFQANYIQH